MPLEELVTEFLDRGIQAVFTTFMQKVSAYICTTLLPPVCGMVYWLKSLLMPKKQDIVSIEEKKEYMIMGSIERLYESDNYLVLNKPYDMYINSTDCNEKNTLIYRIADHNSHLKTSTNQLHFVHRLDYATSGAICLARNKTSAAAAGRHFEKRTTRKYYLAVVRGRVERDVCDITYDVGEDVLIQDGSNRMRAVTCAEDAPACANARPARTRLLVLDKGYYEDDPVSVVLLKPTTGRRHQLRVHCSCIGHTILGDYTYSGRRDGAPHRMFLHAVRLVIPLENEPLDIETEEPYLNDKKFSMKWRSEKSLHGFSTSEDRSMIYEMIDSVYNIECFDYNKC